MHNIVTQIDLLDEILEPWQEIIGDDFQGYKNHVLRMLNYCFYLVHPEPHEKEILIIAAAFHDIGIWSTGKLNPDYIPQSIIELEIYLEQFEKFKSIDDITFIVENHHKIGKIKEVPSHFLAEMFRIADLADLSLGFFNNDIPKAYIKKVKEMFPNAGFHKRLWKLTLMQLKSNPLNPLPMMHWK